MATVTEELLSSPLEGANLFLIYDNISLIASGFQISVGNDSIRTCTVTVVLQDESSLSGTFKAGQFNQIINIPNQKRPQGIQTVGKFGNPTIAWPLKSYGWSFST